MLSVNKAGLACLIFMGVTACGHVDVHAPNIRGVAYVDLTKATKAHPLYPQVQQLEASITAIDLSAAVPIVPKSPAQMKADIAGIKAQLADAEQQSAQAVAQLQGRFVREERAAVVAALRAGGLNTAAQNYASAPLVSSPEQAKSIEAAAASNLQDYQRSVIAQGQATLKALADRLHEQAQGQYQTRAAQYARNESDLSLRLSQQDATSRLAIQTKLNNLALDDAEHAKLAAELKAIDSAERAQVGALRSRDDSNLAAYQRTLEAAIAKKVSAQAAILQVQTQDQLKARQVSVSQQLSKLSGPTLPANLPRATQAQIEQIGASFDQRYQNDVSKISDAFNQTRSSLEAQYAALQGADVGAVGAAKDERDRLSKERSDLLIKIGNQIVAAAQKIAKRDGFTVVLSDPIATPGGYDITGEVISSLKSTGT